VLTYEKAGVSIDRGDEVVRRIQGFVSGIGDFGGRFPLDVAGMSKPVLVAGADGVGTKIRVAIDGGFHDTVGIDLVAMNVNDVLCSGAKPLFFLDYVASSRLDPDVIERVIRGIVEGCRQAGCALLGGETAEMPGFYGEGDYDLAGFAVGIVDEPKIIGPEKVREDDVLLGIPSSGLHSNGYSLARAALESKYDEPFGDATGTDGSVRDAMAAPTKIYCKAALDVVAGCEIHAAAHITGGGIPGNIVRVAPEGLGIEIDGSAWSIPPLFRLIQTTGKIPDDEMRKTFNLGIGFILVMPAASVAAATAILAKHSEQAVIVGRVVKGEGCRWKP
jgi:phosphoribosylformylglycinamidine cyclo-ligase